MAALDKVQRRPRRWYHAGNLFPEGVGDDPEPRFLRGGRACHLRVCQQPSLDRLCVVRQWRP
eukprot:5143625-Prorocentrum_lima.AAC.1